MDSSEKGLLVPPGSIKPQPGCLAYKQHDQSRPPESKSRASSGPSYEPMRTPVSVPCDCPGPSRVADYCLFPNTIPQLGQTRKSCAVSPRTALVSFRALDARYFVTTTFSNCSRGASCPIGHFMGFFWSGSSYKRSFRVSTCFKQSGCGARTSS